MRKVLKNKWYILFTGLLLGHFLIFAGIIATSNFYYQTNDDTTIIALASGAYGQPSEYLDNLHIFLGYLFKFLFGNFPYINWITLFFIAVIFISFIIIDCILIRLFKDCNVYQYAIIFSIVEICWFMIITYFTFTIVAYICCIAGMSCWVYNYYFHTEKKWSFVGGTLLIIGTLIRAEVLKSLILVLLPVLLYSGYRRRKLIQTSLLIVIPSILMFFMINTHTFLYGLNETQKKFWEWGEIRSSALDCAPVDYFTHEQQFTSIGVDYNIYQMIYNQYYFDYDAVNKEVFTNLKEINSFTEKYNFDILGIIEMLIGKNIGILHYEQMYRIILLGIIIFALANYKKTRIETVLITFSTLLTTGIFYFINRPVYRVIMPNYLFAFILILIISCSSECSQKKYIDNYHIHRKRRLIILSHLIIYILPFITLISFIYFNPIQKNEKYTRHNIERQQIYKYLEAHDDKLYLSGNLSVYSIDVCRPVLEFAGKNSFWNLLGNWETFSVPYYDLLEHYNIENPDRLVLELPDSDTLRIISNQGLDYINFADFFCNYMKNVLGRPVEIIPEEYIATLPDGEWWTFRVIYAD